MKSVLFVLDGGFDGGGAERVATRLIDGWVAMGIKVTVLSLSAPSNEVYKISDQVTRIYLGEIRISSNIITKCFYHIFNIFKLRNAIRDNHSDVVLSFLTRTNIRTILASVGLSRRVVISERNDPYRQKYKWFWKILRYLLYRHANVVTANTHNAIEYMKHFVPVKKLTYISNPIQLPDLQAYPSTSKSILNVGRLVPQKSQVMLLEAVAATGVKDWTINILGEGPEEKSLVLAANKLGMEDQLELHGFVKKTADFYLGAGIFVLPSLYEGMPNALLEAMSYGLPCIVSDSLHGALEHIEHDTTGLVFKAGDVTDLAKQILRLIENGELRQQLGMAARIRMSEFPYERIIDEWNCVLFTSAE